MTLRWYLTGAMLISVFLLLLTSTVAVADPPRGRVKPLECLNQWSNNDDYVGEGWVRANVATINGAVLNCGDEFTGVVHIAGKGTTGSGHPISGATESYFMQCFDLVARFGERSPDPDGPERVWLEYEYFSLTRPDAPSRATAILEERTGLVRTMFTSTGAEGNDWLACAAAAQIA